MRCCSLWILCTLLHLEAQPSPKALHKKVGQISEDSTSLKYSFLIQNKTHLPLQIDTVYSDCACALLEWPRSPIAPHEVAPLMVSYDLRSQLGNFEKHFKVVGNQGTYTQTFVLSGEVVPGRAQAAVLYPIHRRSLQLLSEVLHFGVLRGEEPVSMYFFVYNSGEDSLGFRASELPAHLELRFLPDRLPPKSVARWQLTYYPNRRHTAGYQLDELLVYVTERNTARPVKCFAAATSLSHSSNNVSIKVAPREKSLSAAFSLERSVHNFGQVHQEEALMAAFPFQNTGQGSLHIVHVRSSCECIHVQSYQKTYAVGERGSLVVAIDASKLSGHQEHQIEVHTNDTKTPVKVLTVRFFVKK